MEFPVKMEQVVAWGDMDAFGHVNNVLYLRYFESARVYFFADIPNYAGFSGPVKPVLAGISCEYKRPVVYPDTLTLHVGVKSMGNSSFKMACEMHSEKVGLAAKAECTIVMFNFERKRPVRLPQDLRDAMQAMHTEEIPTE